MTAEQLGIAIEFVDELLSLGVLEESPDDDPVLSTCPLFVLPKAGQPGQWRIIANAKTGGQNACVGSDPVVLPSADYVLRQLYSGGWSAVIDASKFFYQFRTVITERKFLGLVHPGTGKVYRYAGLPMGCGNSPSIAGRLGAAFLRRLTERHPDVFGGTPQDNTWKNQVAAGNYDSRLSHGRVLIRNDHLPAVLGIDFMDDFFLHGPTYAKTKKAVNCFMDYAVEVGLLCNPVKVMPPAQQVKYCGFVFDTTGAPRLRVPSAKRSRAHCMISNLQSFDQSRVPRLSLVVVAGVLESMVDTTPARTGHTFLRRVYDEIWATTSPPPFHSPRSLLCHRFPLDQCVARLGVVAANLGIRFLPSGSTLPHCHYYCTLRRWKWDWHWRDRPRTWPFKQQPTCDNRARANVDGYLGGSCTLLFIQLA